MIPRKSRHSLSAIPETAEVDSSVSGSTSSSTTIAAGLGIRPSPGQGLPKSPHTPRNPSPSQGRIHEGPESPLVPIQPGDEHLSSVLAAKQALGVSRPEVRHLRDRFEQHLGNVRCTVVSLNETREVLGFSTKLQYFFPSRNEDPDQIDPMSEVGSGSPRSSVFTAPRSNLDSASLSAVGVNLTMCGASNPSTIKKGDAFQRLKAEGQANSSVDSCASFDSTGLDYSFPYRPENFDENMFFSTIGQCLQFSSQDTYRLWLSLGDLSQTYGIDPPGGFAIVLQKVEELLLKEPEKADFIYFLVEKSVPATVPEQVQEEQAPAEEQTAALETLEPQCEIWNDTSTLFTAASLAPPGSPPVSPKSSHGTSRTRSQYCPSIDDARSLVSYLSRTSKHTSRIPVRVDTRKAMVPVSNSHGLSRMVKDLIIPFSTRLSRSGTFLSRLPRWMGWVKGARQPPRPQSSGRKVAPSAEDKRQPSQKLPPRAAARAKIKKPKPASARPGTATMTSFPPLKADKHGNSTGLAALKATCKVVDGPGDFTGDLESLIPPFAQPSENQWQECCSLLLLDPNRHKNPLVRSIDLPQTRLSITPRQLWAAFQMLTSRLDRDICGGILADAPGTGKSHVILTVVVLRALIAYNRAEVEREWEAREHWKKLGRPSAPYWVHSPRHSQGPCKCQNLADMECYANAKGVTRQIAPFLPRGVSLLMVPSPTLSDWAELLTRAKLKDRYFEPYKYYPNTTGALKPPEDIHKRFKITSKARQDAPPKTQRPVRPGDPDSVFQFDEDPRRQPERYIFLTSHGADAFVTRFQTEFRIPPSSGARGKVRKDSVYSCPVGLQFVDEFHQVPRDGHPVVLARKHKALMDGDFHFWAVTGTPMPHGFGDVAPVVDILARESWKATSHRQHFTSLEQIDTLEKLHQTAIALTATDGQVHALKREAVAFFFGRMVVRHTKLSKFFGAPICAEPETRVGYMTLRTPPKFLGDVRAMARLILGSGRDPQDLAALLQSPTMYTKLCTLQTLAAFPGAARLVAPGIVSLRTDQIRRQIRHSTKRQIDDVALFDECLDKIMEGSPVVPAILVLIDHMRADRQQRPKEDASGCKRDQRDDLSLKKMLITTPRLAEAVFLYKALRKVEPSLRVGILHPEQKQVDRKAVLADFNSLRPRNCTEILITSFDSGGTGLNLQIANYQVITGPLGSKADEVQCFGRTDRQGQQLKVHQYMFLTDDNPAAQLIVAKQAGRQVDPGIFNWEF
ncbi:uncharacterized protein E0L32_010616 [Thyridium curvatum]|uniref:Helicase C-terminal domain-containing protein n=1 Tax=Thyridium curvatum TaxID=1093900 RepID=A0A507AU42_9PEZI|nr:uncharacterized protein E0L32_010616 [Thyridium curvatum]TPX07720.1 hypothetical protein E0L32_010616 [Thyridium curvatum]